MTIKQKRFVKKYLASGNGTQSVLDSYNTENPNTAAVIASENLRKLKVIEEINRILDRKGLGIEKVSESVGLIFERGVETKVTGDNVLRAAEMVLKLHRAFPDKKTTHFRYEARQELEKMSYRELLDRYKNRQEELAELLED